MLQLGAFLSTCFKEADDCGSITRAFTGVGGPCHTARPSQNLLSPLMATFSRCAVAMAAVGAGIGLLASCCLSLLFVLRNLKTF